MTRGNATGKLGVGVIGLGDWGERHLHAYRSIHHTEIVAVASRSAERAREIAARYDVPRHYTDYAALIDDPAVEAISVVTAEHDHLAPTLAALAAGKPVLVEKPLAATLADADAMVAAARQSSGFLMPAHILRFEPKYVALKEAVARGDLGELTAITTRRNRPRGLVATHGRAGPTLVTAIHDLDILLWVAQSRVTRVRAHHRTGTKPGEPCGVWALLTLESGVVATVESSWMMPDGVEPAADDAFSVFGTGGVARIQYEVPGLWLSTEGSHHAPDLSVDARMHGASVGALRDELAYFASCALDGVKPDVIAPEDGRAALAVALAMIESATRNAEVEC